MTRSNQQIKDRPILFSGQMVRAILDGHKTQTRRVVKPQPSYEWTANEDQKWLVWKGQNGWTAEALPSACPYGQPGERLYVKETYYAYGRWETRYSEKKGRDEWHFIDKTLDCRLGYRYADNPPKFVNRKRISSIVRWWKRPALFMPRAASRILLENKLVRAERIKDISESDAIAEGVESFRPVPGDGPAETLWKNYTTGKFTFRTARESFFSLIQSIYGPEFLEQNPWVWVVEFKRL